jgi:hypothetical protein
MKAATCSGRTGKSRKLPLHSTSETHTVGPVVRRVVLPEVEVFTDSVESAEVQALTRDLREVHDAQVADDDYQ